jgi:hypothetical protein
MPEIRPKARPVGAGAVGKLTNAGAGVGLPHKSQHLFAREAHPNLREAMQAPEITQ